MKRDIFEEYAVQVAKEFHLELDSLYKKSKQRNLVDARQILYLLCVDRPIRLSFIKFPIINNMLLQSQHHLQC